MKKAGLLVLSTVLFWSCEKELDFHYHEVNSQLVVEATLTEECPNIILTMTTPMNEPIDTTRLTDAKVTLTDLNLNETFTLSPDIYKSYSGEIQGVPGHEYSLEISRKGERYQSTCKMLPAVEIVDLKFEWIKMPYDYVAILEVVSTVLEDKDVCYWTRIYRNGEFYKWLVSHGSGATNGVLSQTTFTTRKDLEQEDEKDILREGDMVSVSVTPISLEMYDYITAISSDSNGPMMFKGDFCLGYFLASQPALSSIVFHPDSF